MAFKPTRRARKHWFFSHSFLRAVLSRHLEYDAPAVIFRKTSTSLSFKLKCPVYSSAKMAADFVRFTHFRPCIDLHDGKVKQIVGGTLSDNEEHLRTNFIASHNAGFYASRFREDNLTGGHVIKLGPGNDTAAQEALATWPGGLQIGGSVTIDNAQSWLDKGAAKVIVTSWLFPSGKFSLGRLQQLSSLIGKEQLVIDLSCRRQKNSWFVAINKWQTVTSLEITKECLEELSPFASEFLVHAADVEGLCKGIDEDLIKVLGQWSPIPCTYAGGGKDITDLELVNRLSNGKVDLTFGSALDLFGGKGVKYTDCVEWNRNHPR